MTPPAAVDVARFRNDLAALAPGLDALEAPLALAVSGGADSMAMLALAHAAFPGRVIAATVDHGLRPESADEAAMVADWCAAQSIPHATLRVPEAPDPRDNLHNWARGQRYRLLNRWAIESGMRHLLTAHHADDQAETFLMRAARGSGVSGLAGIRPRQDVDVRFPVGGEMLIFDVYRLAVLRPLLGWRRHELREITQWCKLPFVDDPSNDDPRFDRARFRALLAGTDLLDAAQMALSAAHAAEADATLRAMQDWLWERCRVTPAGVDDPDDQCWLDPTGLPRELKRRLARMAIEQVRDLCGITRPSFGEATNIEPLLDALEAGKAATQAGVLVTPKGDIWRFAVAPPRRDVINAADRSL